MGAIKLNEQKVNRSSLIWKVLYKVSEPLTCKEIAYAAALENDLQNISATLSVFVKAKSVKIGESRICTVSGKRSKTYIKNTDKPLEEKEIIIENSNKKITIVIENNVITITRD
jgi:hypothetical protein